MNAVSFTGSSFGTTVLDESEESPKLLQFILWGTWGGVFSEDGNRMTHPTLPLSGLP